MKNIIKFYNRYIDHFYFYLGIGTILSNYYIIFDKLVIEGTTGTLYKSLFTSPEILFIQGGETIILALFSFLIDGRLKSFAKNLLILAIASPFLSLSAWPWIGGHPLLLFLIGLPPMIVLLIIWLFVRIPTDPYKYERSGPWWLNHTGLFFKFATGIIYYSYIHADTFDAGAILITAGLLLLVTLLSIALYYRYGATIEKICDSYIAFGVLIIISGYLAGSLNSTESVIISSIGLLFIVIGIIVKKVKGIKS